MKKGIGLSLGLALVMGAAYAGGQGSATTQALAEKVKSAGDATALVGKDGWLFFVPELRYLTAGTFWGARAATVSHAPAGAQDPLPIIVDFKNQLAKAGIELLVVPIPGKAAIYPDMLVGGSAPTTRIDTAQAEFLKVLGQNGVKALDLTPAFLSYRKAHPTTALYSKQDTHWSGTGIAVAADAISAIVKKQGWYAATPKTKYVATTNTVKFLGDMASMLPNVRLAPETLTLTSVKGVSSNRQSPLVVLGDSHNLVYSVGGEMLASASGFPESLALRLGFAPDVVAVMGSGATPARGSLARRGDNMKGKKMVVWVFTSREFTEGQGWRPVPVIR